MPAGRPTKYNDKMQAKADAYLADCSQFGDVFPTIEGLSLLLELDQATLQRWSNDDRKPKFCKTLENLRRKQKNVIMQRSMSGEFNSAIAKLVLSANHGMKETTVTDNVSSDGSMSPVTKIELVGVNGKD